MMEENVGENIDLFLRVKVLQNDASIGKRLIGRGKHRERPCTLKGCYQVRLRQGSNKGIVNARACCVGGDVLGRIRRGVERKGRGR